MPSPNVGLTSTPAAGRPGTMTAVAHIWEIPVGGRRTWAGYTGLILALGLIEVVVVAFLGHRFLPAGTAWVLDAVGGLALLLVTLAVASVMWRRHRLDEGRMRLVLGYLGQIDVPRSLVASVEELPALKPQEADLTGPAVVDGQLNLTAAVGLPRVVVTFSAPIVGRRLWQHRRVHSVVTTDPQRLLLGGR